MPSRKVKVVTLLGAFFNSFRKDPVVCRSLELDLSGKVAKKTTLTRIGWRESHPPAATTFPRC